MTISLKIKIIVFVIVVVVFVNIFSFLLFGVTLLNLFIPASNLPFNYKISCGNSIKQADINIDGKQVFFSGAINTATPCYSLSAYYHVEKINDYDFPVNLAIVDISPNQRGNCVLCLGEAHFNGSIKMTSEKFGVRVNYRNRTLAEAYNFIQPKEEKILDNIESLKQQITDSMPNIKDLIIDFFYLNDIITINFTTPLINVTLARVNVMFNSTVGPLALSEKEEGELLSVGYRIKNLTNMKMSGIAGPELYINGTPETYWYITIYETSRPQSVSWENILDKALKPGNFSWAKVSLEEINYTELDAYPLESIYNATYVVTSFVYNYNYTPQIFKINVIEPKHRFQEKTLYMTNITWNDALTMYNKGIFDMSKWFYSGYGRTEREVYVTVRDL